MEKQLLKHSGECGKIKTTRWLVCPVCGVGKILKLLPNSEAKNLLVYCRRCRKEFIVNIPLEPAP